MCFFEVVILEIIIRIFKFVWEILPIQPTIQTREKNQHPPLFLQDENIFQKSAPLVLWRTEFPKEPTEPIFEICSHLREKWGVLMVSKATPTLGAKAQ